MSDLIIPGNLPVEKKKSEEFREWSNCFRRPAWWEEENAKDFASSLIVSCDLHGSEEETWRISLVV